MQSGIGILSVGAGETMLTFDKNNAAELIRAARIVTDMLRHGYALVVEVAGADGAKSFQRVKEFDPETSEYIIADLDSVQAAKVDAEDAQSQEDEAAEAGGAGPPAASPRKTKGKRNTDTRRIAAAGTRGVAIARSSGG